jgi:hypothetical protein
MDVGGILIVCFMLGTVGCCAACKLFIEIHKQNKRVHVLHV